MVAGAAVVFVGAGVGVVVAVALGVVVAPCEELFVGFELGVFLVAAGDADADVDVDVGVDACAVGVCETCPPEVLPPNDPESEPVEVVEVICGGVIAKTAPSPPTVPPAIRNMRFMRELWLPILRSI